MCSDRETHDFLYLVIIAALLRASGCVYKVFGNWCEKCLIVQVSWQPSAELLWLTLNTCLLNLMALLNLWDFNLMHSHRCKMLTQMNIKVCMWNSILLYTFWTVLPESNSLEWINVGRWTPDKIDIKAAISTSSSPRTVCWLMLFSDWAFCCRSLSDAWGRRC